MDASDTKAPRPDRAGLKTVVTYLPSEVAKQIKLIAVERDRTVQKICEEAIMQWLAANGGGQVVTGDFSTPKSRSKVATLAQERAGKKVG